MESNKFEYEYKNVIQLDNEQDVSRRFMANVFLWMFAGLAISSVVAYLFNTPQFRSLLIDPVTMHTTGLATVLMFAPFIFVMVMSFGLSRISQPVLALLFVAFSALMGASLSFVLLLYTSASVLGVFITASVVFGIMAIAGYTTHQDLTKFGSLLIMALFGLIIATLLNMFFPGLHLDKAITYLGVIIFVGLTAYDVQRIKRMAQNLEYQNMPAGKLAIMGALTLYLDFINLFLYLLRLFGRRK